MSDLEYQAATLAARHAGLWIAGAHVLVGVLQCAVVAWGIRAMVRANNERAASAAEDRREDREARREDREALEAAQREDREAREAAQREDREAREAAQREDREAREAARREADQRHAETMEAFKTQSRALEALIERTAPGAAQ